MPARVVHDHTVVRDGIRAVLERQSGEFEVVAEAADIPSMVKLVSEHKPDLLTLDLEVTGDGYPEHAREELRLVLHGTEADPVVLSGPPHDARVEVRL